MRYPEEGSKRDRTRPRGCRPAVLEKGSQVVRSSWGPVGCPLGPPRWRKVASKIAQCRQSKGHNQNKHHEPLTRMFADVLIHYAGYGAACSTRRWRPGWLMKAQLCNSGKREDQHRTETYRFSMSLTVLLDPTPRAG